ncbi:G2/M phase-specific E3 ubiquitin-protein ligase-like [Branchiostoma floridae x Branchiostoma japonicum]
MDVHDIETIEQLKEGLKVLGLFGALGAEPQLLVSLLCKATESVTADSIRRMFKVNWAPEGANRKDKGMCSASVSLKDFLKFFTALEIEPLTGWSQEPSLTFKECDTGCCCLPVSCTCSPMLIMPEHMGTLTDTEFGQKMEEAIIGGCSFGRA